MDNVAVEFFRKAFKIDIGSIQKWGNSCQCSRAYVTVGNKDVP